MITLVLSVLSGNPPKGRRGVMVRPYTVSLVYIKTSVTFIYILGIFEGKDSQSSSARMCKS